MSIATAMTRTKEANTDRLCENCGHDWRGAPECPVCGYTEPAPEPLAPESPSMVTICGWCNGARERHDAAVAFGRVVTTGICAPCADTFLREGPDEAKKAMSRAARDRELIAELLEALQRCAEFLDDYTDVTDGEDGTLRPNRALSLQQDAEAAIAKAEGR